MYLSILISLIVFRTTWVVTASPNNGTCYDIDGDQTAGIAHVVCDPEAEVSLCYAYNDVCLSFGLCGVNLSKVREI